jgi:hypothetical protein
MRRYELTEFEWPAIAPLLPNKPRGVPRQDTLAFQIDLWSARGEFSGNLAEVATRRKEIQHSSGTRANTDHRPRWIDRFASC